MDPLERTRLVVVSVASLVRVEAEHSPEDRGAQRAMHGDDLGVCGACLP